MILAAGTLPWRRRRSRLEVALVHRPRYDDWAWAKGKLDPGESFPAAAVRETHEETGLRVRLGLPLPRADYEVKGREKRVRYWAAEVVGGDGRLVNEIDDVAWLALDAAACRLDYPRDRDQLDAVAAADAAGALRTWPLLLVRHAKARPRDSWRRPDPLRPLDPRGREQSRALVPVLGAYGVTRLVSSPSLRCSDTLAPYAKKTGSRVRFKPGLSEEGYAEDAARCRHHLERVVAAGDPAALCSHGPVLPDLLGLLAGRVAAEAPGSEATAAALRAAAEDNLAKGEALVAHVAGVGEKARVVGVERHLPRPGPRAS